MSEFMPYVDGVIRETFWYHEDGGSDWWRTDFYNALAEDYFRGTLGKMEIFEMKLECLRQHAHPPFLPLLPDLWRGKFLLRSEGLLVPRTRPRPLGRPAQSPRQSHRRLAEHPGIRPQPRPSPLLARM